MSDEELAKRKFLLAVNALKDALESARGVWPDAELYLASGGTLNLMSGPHHEGNRADPRPDRIMASRTISGMDGGDW